MELIEKFIENKEDTSYALLATSNSANETPLLLVPSDVRTVEELLTELLEAYGYRKTPYENLVQKILAKNGPIVEYLTEFIYVRVSFNNFSISIGFVDIYEGYQDSYGLTLSGPSVYKYGRISFKQLWACLKSND